MLTRLILRYDGVLIHCAGCLLCMLLLLAAAQTITVEIADQYALLSLLRLFTGIKILALSFVNTYGTGYRQTVRTDTLPIVVGTKLAQTSFATSSVLCKRSCYMCKYGTQRRRHCLALPAKLQKLDGLMGLLCLGCCSSCTYLKLLHGAKVVRHVAFLIVLDEGGEVGRRHSPHSVQLRLG